MLGGRAERDSGSRKTTATTATTTIGALIRKTEPHQKWSSRNPPTIGPIGKLSMVDPAIAATAFGRSSWVNSTGSTDSASGKSAAAPTPSTARAAISSPVDEASAQARELAP